VQTGFLNFASLIHARATEYPDRIALVFEGAGVRPDAARTFDALWRNGQALARGLRASGVRPGSVFGLLMANHAEFVELMVAAALLNAVVVPIDPRTKGEKLAFMLRNSGAEGVVAADYALPNIEEVLDLATGVQWVFGLATDEGPGRALWSPRVRDFAAVAMREGEDLPLPDSASDSPMQIIHTSGTTGDPKGIVMTHRRYCATAEAAHKMFGYAQSDRLYSGLSLTHANAQLVTLGAALHGGLTAVFSRRFTKSRLWDITRQYGCTTFTLLGGMTTAVYAQPRRPDDAHNPVRFVVSAGMPASLWKEFERRFGVSVLEFYGSAEGGLVVNPIEKGVGKGPVGSIGKPAPGLKWRIVDEFGRDVSPGAPGELLLAPADGTPVQVEYIGDAQASAAKCKDGWLHMGDVVRADEEGWLYFLFRKGGGIRRNGDFISSAFVERVIAESGLVDDVYVYGIPAGSGAPGEKDVVAAVVPTDPATFDAQKLFAHCRQGLEPNFVPSFVQVVGEIPKTASEKPQDRHLIDLLAARTGNVHVEKSR
jgi:crotonobetaine/carnitine-CoA ligase